MQLRVSTHPEVRTGVYMTSAGTKNVIVTTEDLHRASLQLSSTLLEFDAPRLVMLDALYGGMAFREYLETDALNTRPRLSAALSYFDEARHRAILACVSAALEEGMTITDFAKHFGFSRQHASRLAQSLRK